MHSSDGPAASAGVFLLLLTLLVPAGCRSGSSAVNDAPVLRIGFGIGSSAKETSLPALTDLLYAESLLTREWDGRQTERLATRWGWEEDGRTLRLELKDGVRLHDGARLTAPLVTRVLEGIVAQGRHRAAVGFEHVTGVEAIDDRTILIRLSQPDIFLLTALSDRKIVHPDNADIGTGPFKLLTRKPNVETMRFDEYHAGMSPLGGVNIITYDTSRSVWSALMRGEIDAAQEVSGDSVEFMERSSNVRIYPSLQSFYVALVFNVRHGALRHPEVRRALSRAIDRDEILARAMRGRGQVASGPIWPMYWAYEPPPDAYAYAPHRTRAELDAAGFPLPSGGKQGALRKRFTFRCLVYNEDPLYERIALMVQRQLFDLGVDMTIELVGMDTFVDRAAAGDFDAFLMRINSGRSLDVTYRFWHSSVPGRTPLQNSGYTGADGVLDQLRVSTSDAAVRRSVSELAKRFYADAPAVFIAWLEVTRAIDASYAVGGNSSQDPFSNIWQWRPTGEGGT